MVVGYAVDAFVVGANVLALAGLPGEADDVEVFVRIAIEDVVIEIVELVVAFTLAAEVMHEQTAPASTFGSKRCYQAASARCASQSLNNYRI